MKTMRLGILIGLVFLFVSPSLSRAHEALLGTKPVVASTAMYEPHEGLHLGTPIMTPSRPLEGSKPVIKMLGEVPSTTLTTQHLRREPWKYEGELFYGSKPVLKMLRE